MGYPGKNHKTYSTPKRRFEKSRIEEEVKLVIEYGLRNKKELWKAQSALRKYRKATREILALESAGTDTTQSEAKKQQLLNRLERYGLVGGEADIDDVLALKTEQELERRLQTVVYRKGLARSPKQARQFITHGHIAIGNRKVTIPGYMVPRDQESQIEYYGHSPLATESHAERTRISGR
ncbi:30S ribosomal protein S4 [Methanofollis aquaemaris]|uniref:Small ribosomal subunit protein uS4 n=1 Tax=Methanofollis aquaemaris TaxID=126734 RepID=A0A8A3S726_9EURY|nr:30S ribosomal protein S4 [Methanofollis aquaemaris]QSZ67743.1 30S ribosomal protein S4 [Methanofollis aquaemaris]